jgi:mono/diheme cytochrome c family protein
VAVSPKAKWCLLSAACLAVVALFVPLAFGDNGAGLIPMSEKGPGNLKSGRQVFVSFCGKCHTMAAAGSKGTLGPNLDHVKVPYSGVVSAVEQGVGGIQAEYILRFVTFKQVQDVAAYVVLNSGCAKANSHCRNTSESV